jgi:hypothetical protein
MHDCDIIHSTVQYIFSFLCLFAYARNKYSVIWV